MFTLSFTSSSSSFGKLRNVAMRSRMAISKFHFSVAEMLITNFYLTNECSFENVFHRATKVASALYAHMRNVLTKTTHDKAFFVPNEEPAFSWRFGNGPVRVDTQGFFRPCLKTFVTPFNPAFLTRNEGNTAESKNVSDAISRSNSICTEKILFLTDHNVS